jgi:galactokinase/mevalonate kinase-like predicted kinase
VTGKRGGAGGGGGILVVCDTVVAETIVYNTSAGLLSSEDTHSASNGSTYILINS